MAARGTAQTELVEVRTLRRAVGAILFLAVCLLSAGCSTREQVAQGAGAGPAASGLPLVTVTPALASAADLPRITASELESRLRAGEAMVVVDVRSQESYAQQHIAGAISMPEREVAARASELPLDRLIVFYCA